MNTKKMTTADYNTYSAAIKTANENEDKKALEQIQLQLIATYGLENDNVRELLKKFKYTMF